MEYFSQYQCNYDRPSFDQSESCRGFHDLLPQLDEVVFFLESICFQVQCHVLSILQQCAHGLHSLRNEELPNFQGLWHLCLRIEALISLDQEGLSFPPYYRSQLPSNSLSCSIFSSSKDYPMVLS